MDFLAQHDQLTQLPNRVRLIQMLRQALSLASVKQRTLAVLLIDLDHFKTINDSLGHQAGDLLLCEVAQRLRGSVRAHDLVARVGGDEFVVVLTDDPDPQETETQARHLQRIIEAPCTIDGTPLVVSPCMGIAMYPGDGKAPRNCSIAPKAPRTRPGQRPAQPAVLRTRPRRPGHPDADAGAATARRAGARRVRAALPAPDLHGRWPAGGLRGPGTLAPPAARPGAARRVHRLCRGARPDLGHRPLGAARGLPPGSPVAGRGAAARTPVRECLRAGISPAQHGARGGPGAGGNRPGSALAAHRADRVHADAHQRPGAGHLAGAAGPGRGPGHRRLRHRLFLAGLSAPPPHQPAQDRPVLHRRRAR